MADISIPQAKSSFFLLDLPAITPEEKKILKERTIIYNAFLKTLKNLEEQTEKKIEKLKKYPKQETQEQQDYLEKTLAEQNELLARLQSEEEKKIFDFLLANHKNIFKVDQKKIKKIDELNEKSFSRLLVFVYEEIRENLKNGEIKKVSGKLADEKSLERDEIKEVVDDCVDKAHRTEAGDWFFDSIKNNIPWRDFLRKLPGFEKILGKEEEEEKKQLSEIGMATKFLRESSLPIITLIIVISLGGLSGPISVFGLTIPHAIVIGSAVLGFVAAEYKAVKGLFSNDEKCIFVDDSAQSFSSQDIDAVDVTVQEQKQQKQKEAKEQAKKCGERFSEAISKIILETKVQGAAQSNGSKEVIVNNQPAPTDPASTKWQQSVQAKAGETLFRS